MKRIIRAIFFPPNWFRWVFGVVSITAVLCVFLLDLSSAPIAYAAFFASALGLYYLITVTIIPLSRRIKALLMRNRYIRRYYEDKEFKARIILYGGLILNVLYAAFKLVTGIYYVILRFLSYQILTFRIRFRYPAGSDNLTSFPS